MMLVASLFISGSYDKIAGYAPGSQVTDHNAVDLDQKVMEDHLKAGDFAKAMDVYEQGGNSKSYAELTVPATTKVIKKGAEMTATAKSGATITADVVYKCVGVMPNTAMLKESPFAEKFGFRNSIEVNDHLQARGRRC